MLLDTSGLQSDLLVVEARARGPFFGESATKKWTIIDWKVNVSKPAPIHGEHQSPAQWPHTRIFPGKTKLVLQPRSSTIQQTYTKPTFSCSPKPTNDKQPTNQKEWSSAKYTWNALAQVWSARLKKRRDYNVKVAFRGFPLVFVFSWKFLTPIQLKLCKTQTGCRYRAL